MTDDVRGLGYYTLDADHNLVEATDLLAWGEWMGENNRQNRVVKQESIGQFWVSTVFLGIDHGFARMFGNADAPPIVYETMVFLGGSSETLDIQERCSTWDEALAQHERVCAEMRKAANG